MATYAHDKRSLERKIRTLMQHANRELQYVNKALAELPKLRTAISKLNANNMLQTKKEIIGLLKGLDKELDRAKRDLPKTSSQRARIEVEQGKWKQLIAITQAELTAKNRMRIPAYRILYGPYLKEYEATAMSLKEYLNADFALSQQFLTQQEALDKTA
jgi:hypothetical protein